MVSQNVSQTSFADRRLCVFNFNLFPSIKKKVLVLLFMVFYKICQIYIEVIFYLPNYLITCIKLNDNALFTP